MCFDESLPGKSQSGANPRTSRVCAMWSATMRATYSDIYTSRSFTPLECLTSKEADDARTSSAAIIRETRVRGSEGRFRPRRMRYRVLQRPQKPNRETQPKTLFVRRFLRVQNYPLEQVLRGFLLRQHKTNEYMPHRRCEDPIGKSA